MIWGHPYFRKASNLSRITFLPCEPCEPWSSGSTLTIINPWTPQRHPIFSQSTGWLRTVVQVSTDRSLKHCSHPTHGMSIGSSMGSRNFPWRGSRRFWCYRAGSDGCWSSHHFCCVYLRNTYKTVYIYICIDNHIHVTIDIPLYTYQHI